NTWRKRLFHILHGLVEGHRHIAGILPHPHEGESKHDLAFAVGGDAAPADHVPDCDLGHVSDPDRNTVPSRDDNLADFLDRAGTAYALYGARLLGPDDVAPTDILVVFLEGLDDVVERELVFRKLRRLGPDLELLGEPAPGIHLRHSRHAPEPRPDHPI